MGRLLSRAEARATMQLAHTYHQGMIPLPPRIVMKKQEIAQATRNAELFMSRTGAIDYGMVEHVVTLKIELDTLYQEWVSESSAAA